MLESVVNVSKTYDAHPSFRYHLMLYMQPRRPTERVPCTLHACWHTGKMLLFALIVFLALYGPIYPFTRNIHLPCISANAAWASLRPVRRRSSRPAKDRKSPKSKLHDAQVNAGFTHHHKVSVLTLSLGVLCVAQAPADTLAHAPLPSHFRSAKTCMMLVSVLGCVRQGACGRGLQLSAAQTMREGTGSVHDPGAGTSARRSRWCLFCACRAPDGVLGSHPEKILLVGPRADRYG